MLGGAAVGAGRMDCGMAGTAADGPPTSAGLATIVPRSTSPDAAEAAGMGRDFSFSNVSVAIADNRLRLHTPVEMM